MGRHGARLAAVLIAAGFVVAAADVARADPLPGFDFDPPQLTARMDSCLAYQLNRDDILMGLVNAKNPRNIDLIKQYDGTRSRAIVAVNESTGDIATIYTEPRPDDWSGCANAL